MTLLSWRPEFQVGVELIDAEHRSLFDLINDVHERYSTGDPHHEVVLALSKLVAYAEAHFQHEQQIMEENGYPKLQAHAGMHDGLFNSIFELNEHLAKGGQSADGETMRFLKRWLVDHILKEDLAFGDYMRRKAAEPAGTPG